MLDSIDVEVPDAEPVMVDGVAPSMDEVVDGHELATAAITRIKDILTSDDPGTIGIVGPSGRT